MKKIITRITDWIKKLLNRPYRLFLLPVINFSRKISLPGFRGVPVYDVGKFFIGGMKKSSITMRANSISYQFIIAFVPAVLFLFTLIPYVPVKGLEESIMNTLKEVMPYDAFILLRSTMEDIITNQQTGLLSISFLVALYFAGSGVIAIMDAFNHSSHAIESRTSFRKQLMALLLVFILAINMIISGAALAISSIVLYFIESKGFFSNDFTFFLLNVGQWIIIILTSLVAFSSIYYFAPAKKRVFPFFSAGAVLASLLSVITFKLFTVFINNFTNYNKFYGSLGAMIMIIVWINLTALMILIGFELNASIYEAYKNGQEKKVS